MSTQEDPSDSSSVADAPPDPAETDAAAGDTVALVDLFDQLDRAAFSRSLAQRKSYYSFRPNRRS
jgi:hypothetical protein